MAEPSTFRGPKDEAGADPGHESAPGTPGYPGAPRWLKVSGIVALILVLLLVIVMFASGGNHGPGRHTPSGGAGGDVSPVAYRVQQL